MDAELLPVALALAHLGGVLVGIEDRRRALDVEARLRPRRAAARRARPGSRRACGRPSAGVLQLRLLRLLEAGPVQQAMGVEGVPDARPVAEREADRRAALADRRARSWRAARAARRTCARGARRRPRPRAASPGLSSNGSKCSSIVDRAAEPLERASSDHRPTAHHGQATSETKSIFMGRSMSPSLASARGAAGRDLRPGQVFPQPASSARIASLECSAPSPKDPPR